VIALASQIIAAETNYSISIELGIANMRRDEVKEAIKNLVLPESPGDFSLARLSEG